jgi:hypothetical protein
MGRASACIKALALRTMLWRAKRLQPTRSNGRFNGLEAGIAALVLGGVGWLEVDAQYF